MNQDIIVKAEPRIEPLFYFDRQCEEAIGLYKKAFGAELTYLSRYSDVSDDLPLNYDAKKDSELIYHAQIKIGNQRIMLCDNLFFDLPKGHSASFVAMFHTFDKVKIVYDALADGATILSPLTNENLCGDLVDKFGIHWSIMVYHN
jgi:PhnB protein